MPAGGGAAPGVEAAAHRRRRGVRRPDWPVLVVPAAFGGARLVDYRPVPRPRDGRGPTGRPAAGPAAAHVGRRVPQRGRRRAAPLGRRPPRRRRRLELRADAAAADRDVGQVPRRLRLGLGRQRLQGRHRIRSGSPSFDFNLF